MIKVFYFRPIRESKQQIFVKDDQELEFVEFVEYPQHSVEGVDKNTIYGVFPIIHNTLTCYGVKFLRAIGEGRYLYTFNKNIHMPYLHYKDK